MPLSYILTQEALSAEVFRLTCHAPDIAAAARPGQFVMVRLAQGFDPLLRRPFSIHSRSAEGSLSLLYKVVGKGTRLLSGLRPGELLDLLGPLGQAFTTIPVSQPVCLVGGGMGIAPLLFLAQELPNPKYILLGARNQAEVAPLVPFFAALNPVELSLATDDGTLGHKGYVPECLSKVLPQVHHVYTCGPWNMMQAVVQRCQQAQVPCQVSLETHMACGMGACLGCVTAGAGGKQVHVCTDGPVFKAEDIQWT